MPSPLAGLVLNSDTPPDRPSPPMNSLTPRLCPPIGLDGVVGVVVNGECGGVVVAVVVAGGARVVAAGLKEKSGRALTDFCLEPPGAEPRRPVGYACSDIGRAFGAYAGSECDASGPRWGKLKSGFGMSSIGPALEV